MSSEDYYSNCFKLGSGFFFENRIFFQGHGLCDLINLFKDSILKRTCGCRVTADVSNHYRTASYHVSHLSMSHPRQSVCLHRCLFLEGKRGRGVPQGRQMGCDLHVLSFKACDTQQVKNLRIVVWELRF